MKGLHIVIVPAWWPSPEQPSAGIFFQDYALAFADAGARVGIVYPDLVSLRHFRRARASLIPRIEREFLRDDIPVIRIRGLHTAFGQPGVQMRRFRSWLKRGLDAYQSLHGKPDILHAMCSIPAGWACTTLGDELATRVVLTEHFGPFAAQMTRRAGGAFVREAIENAAAVVTVSRRSRSDMEKFHFAREILVCGNPVSRVFLDATVPAAPREGPIRGLFVGRLTEEKGVRELVAAASALPGSSSVQWRFVGDGPLRSFVMEKFNGAGRSKACTLTGELPREGVVQEMLAADFLVLPSHGETFGMAVAESLCVGLPVVVTRDTACEDFVDDSNGLLVKPGNAEWLDAALVSMIRRARSYDRDLIAARARERFGPSPIVEFYSTATSEIIARQPTK